MEPHKPGIKGFEAFETLTNALRMGVKMHFTLISLLIILQTVVFIGVITITSSTERKTTLKWLISKTIQQSPLNSLGLRVSQPDGNILHTNAQNLARLPWVRQLAIRELKKIGWIFAASCSIYLFYPLILLVFREKSRKQSSNQYIRGAKLITPDDFWRKTQYRSEKSDFPLGQIALPVNLENRGTMFIGKPGSGKTQAILPLVKRTIDREEKGIIYDYKGDYTSAFYDPEKHLLFNIADKRCLNWCLFNDMVSITDVDSNAASLIPLPLNTNPFWESSARAVFKAILVNLYQNDTTLNRHIWNMLTTPTTELVKLFEETRGAEVALKVLGNGDSRQAEGVMAVLMQYCGCFEYMANINGNFSIKNWVSGDQHNMIFITNLKDIEDTLRPILSLFIDLIIRNLLSLPDSNKRKLFFYLDELGTLQRLMVPDLLTTGRSKGACTFIGNQDTGRTEKIYGPQIMDSMDNALGNRITFCLSGKAAIKESKENIGETEYWEYLKSHSMGPSDFSDRVSINPKHQKEPLFLPSDLSNLPDLTGIIRLRNYNFVKSNWTYKKPQEFQPAFTLRDDLSLEYIKSEQNRLRNEIENLEIEIPESDIEDESIH